MSRRPNKTVLSLVHSETETVVYLLSFAQLQTPLNILCCNLLGKSYAAAGLWAWNHLPSRLRWDISYWQFKRRLKAFLFMSQLAMVHHYDCLLICTWQLLARMMWTKKRIKCMYGFMSTSVLCEFLSLSIRAYAGPWKSLNLCLKVLESAWIWFFKTVCLNKWFSV